MKEELKAIGAGSLVLIGVFSFIGACFALIYAAIVYNFWPVLVILFFIAAAYDLGKDLIK